MGDATAFSEAAARGLHKLTAYKDEYEVARLLTDPAFEARLSAEVPGGTKRRYRLRPPILRAMGWDKKIAFGPWLRPVLRTLAQGCIIRGTLSYTDCAAFISKAASASVSYVQVPPQQVLDGFLAAGLPGWLAEALVALHLMYDTGKLNPHSDAVARLTGRPPRTFEEFVREHAQLFT